MTEQKPAIHPAIMGLLQLLPADGETWIEEYRSVWLKAMADALKLIYGGKDSA